MEEEDLVLAEFRIANRTLGPVGFYRTNLSLRDPSC